MNNDSIKQYQAIWDNAHEIIAACEESLDKHIISIATAFWGASFAILPFIKKEISACVFYATLVPGWFALGASIMVCLISIFGAKISAQKLLKAIEANINKDIDFDDCDNIDVKKCNKLTNCSNLFAFILLLIGIIFCLLFVSFISI